MGTLSAHNALPENGRLGSIPGASTIIIRCNDYLWYDLHVEVDIADYLRPKSGILKIYGPPVHSAITTTNLYRGEGNW
jgi:hypothetical protein